MSDYLSRNYPNHPALTAEAGFKRPMSHTERCACGSAAHRPGTCDYARRAVAEHLARTKRCTVSGCESELAEYPYRCLHCGQPTCWHHFARSSLADSCVHVDVE